MKEYFKYANGYVNINDENLFLTNSGNWSETNDLLEKSPKSIRKNNFKINKINFYYFILIILATIVILSVIGQIMRNTFPFISLVILFLFFSAYRYMQRETGKRYKIPISKISSFEIYDEKVKILFRNSSFEIYDEKVKILFRNANDIDDFEEIFKVEKKGLAILEELSRQLKNTSLR